MDGWKAGQAWKARTMIHPFISYVTRATGLPRCFLEIICNPYHELVKYSLSPTLSLGQLRTELINEFVEIIRQIKIRSGSVWLQGGFFFSPAQPPPIPYTQLSGYHPQIIPEIFVKTFKATLPTKEVAYSLECWIKHRETIKAYAIQPLAL